MDTTLIFLVAIAISIGVVDSVLKNQRRANKKAKAKKQRSAKRQSARPATTSRSSNVKPTATTEPELDTSKWSLALIRALEWKRFERLCMLYFQAKGYRAETTEVGPDGGVDVRLYKPSAQQELLAVVQCKAWNSYRVGVKPVRELYGVQASAKAPLGIFITTSSYSNDAVNFCKDKHLQLIDGPKLYTLIEGLPDNDKHNILTEVTAGDYATPTCVSCDIKMTKRHRAKGSNMGSAFWGCVNFPKCRNTIQIAKT